MPRKPRVQFDGALYHVTSRGNARQAIFHGDDDRARFLCQLQERVASYGVVVYAFVLMDNHYHLLVRTPRGNLNRFMQRLNTSYALYYRYKHRRPGHVFQGRYKALLVTDDDYVLALTRYIHLNPIKTRQWINADPEAALAFLKGYRWSSYPSYITGTAKHDWLNMEVLLHYGRSRKEASARYRAYAQAAVTKEDDDLLNALKEAGRQLGPQPETIRRPSASAWQPPSLDEVDNAVAKHFKVHPESLTRHGIIAGAAKRVAIELAIRHSGLSLKSIGQHYGGISAPAVSMTRKRIRTADLKEADLISRRLK